MNHPDGAVELSREHVATHSLAWEISARWKVARRHKHHSGRPDAAPTSGSSLLNIRGDYRHAFGPIDVTVSLDFILLTGSSLSDDTPLSCRRVIDAEDEYEAEPLVDLRVEFAW